MQILAFMYIYGSQSGAHKQMKMPSICYPLDKTYDILLYAI